VDVGSRPIALQTSPKVVMDFAFCVSIVGNTFAEAMGEDYKRGTGDRAHLIDFVYKIYLILWYQFPDVSQ